MRLALLCLAWLSGIALSATGVLEGAVFLAAGIVALWAIARLSPPSWGLLLLMLLLAGGLRYRAVESGMRAPALEALRGDDAVLSGRVAQEPEERGPRQRLELAVEAAGATAADTPAASSVIVWLPLYPQYHQGDRLELLGQFEAPTESAGFDTAGLLARRGIVGFLVEPRVRPLGGDAPEGFAAWPAKARQGLARALAAGLPEPEASLAAALLFGARSSLPSAVNEAFQATGTSHLLAVSGYNLTLVTGWLAVVFVSVLGRRAALWPSLAAAWAYTALVGDQPPVLRAAAMASLALVAAHLGRPASGVAALALAAAVFAALDPFVLWEPSFQLSFLSVAALLLMADPWRERFEALLESRARWLGWWTLPLRLVAETLLVTTAASLITAPLVALLFQRVALISPLANLLVQPLVPLATVASLPIALVGLLLPGAAPWLAAPAWLSLRGMVVIVERLAVTPGATWMTPQVPGAFIAAVYLAVALLLLGRRWSIWSALGAALRASRRFWPEMSFATASLVVWAAVLLAPAPATLTVEALDVGQGDALLVTAPTGERLLVDGGPDPQRLLYLLGRRLPFWERRFAGLVVSHPQADHLTGLIAVAERYEIGLVVEGDRGDSALYHAWDEVLSRKRIQRVHLVPGQALRLNEISLMLLGPPNSLKGDLNDRSLVLQVSHGELSFLLTGDIEAAGEEALLRSPYSLSSTVLKVAHHGSRTSSTAPFLEAVGPATSVISAGARNPFGHPSPDVLQRLAERPLYRTDQHGTVTFRSDGRRLWVRTER